MPVAPGQMRNEWFPSRTADYVTPMQLREIKANDVSIERDHTFGMEQVEVQGDKGPEVLEIAKPKAIEVEKISVRASHRAGCGSHWVRSLGSSSSFNLEWQIHVHLPDWRGHLEPGGTHDACREPSCSTTDGMQAQRSLELINNLVPARIDVRKSANVRPQQQQKPREQPRHRGMSAADVLAAASAPPPEPVDTRVPIHGSVSTTDIAAIIKEQLSVNEEGSRVVVSESDVRWLNGTSAEDPTRVRFLGEYEVEIKLKGADEGVTRKIRVLPLASSSEVVPEVGS